MMTDDVGRRLAVLEERMNTMQAQYEGALDRLRADLARQGEELARRDARQGEALARRDAENARQATRMTNSLLIAIGVATAVLGVVIALT